MFKKDNNQQIIKELLKHNITIKPTIDKTSLYGFSVSFQPRFCTSDGQFNGSLGKALCHMFSYLFSEYGWTYTLNDTLSKTFNGQLDWKTILNDIEWAQSIVTDIMDRADEWQNISESFKIYNRVKNGVV